MDMEMVVLSEEVDVTRRPLLACAESEVSNGGRQVLFDLIT